MTVEEEYKQFVIGIHNDQIVDINFSAAECLFLEILKMPESERVSIDYASHFIRDSFLKNPDPNFQRYFLMALYYGCKFFEHKYQEEKAKNMNTQPEQPL